MEYPLQFDSLLNYDTGKSGISVPITLWRGRVSADLESKLDTGASHCIFQRFYGEEIGFDIESGEVLTFSTATGAFLTYGHSVLLQALDFEFETLVYFAKDYAFNRNVLGRIGFLNRVLLGLNDYAGKLYLSRNIDDE